jgi:hypothetical protein
VRRNPPRGSLVLVAWTLEDEEKSQETWSRRGWSL